MSPAKTPRWREKKSWTAGRPLFVCDLLRAAAAAHSTTPAMILAKSRQRGPVRYPERQRNVSAARWQVIRALHADPRHFSLPTIGRWLELHHSSVLHCLQQDKQPYASTAPPIPPIFDPSVPDESGAWAI